MVLVFLASALAISQGVVGSAPPTITCLSREDWKTVRSENEDSKIIESIRAFYSNIDKKELEDIKYLRTVNGPEGKVGYIFYSEKKTDIEYAFVVDYKNGKVVSVYIVPNKQSDGRGGYYPCYR